MGSVCSCLCVESLEEYVHPDAPIHRHCSCLRCLAQQLIHVSTAFLQIGEVRAMPLVVPEESSLGSSTPIIDGSISDTYHPLPRPLPYDDPRFSQVQHDRRVSRRDKSVNYFYEETEPLRRSNNDNNIELMSPTDKFSASNYGVVPKLCCSKSLLKNSSMEVPSEVKYNFALYEEDECPTCLEEYTSENPKITMKCSHHFHLGCIYEWKERSEFCPVCGKTMVFNETT